jgi:hypothetical protein
MRQARRAQLIGDPEDPLIVDSADVAARCSDQLRFTRHRAEASKGRGHALPVERKDLIRDRRFPAGLLEQRGGLAAPDPRHVIPALVTSRGLGRTLRGDKVGLPRRMDSADRQRRRRDPPPLLGWRPGKLREVEPPASLLGPGLPFEFPLTLRLEDLDCGFGQVDRPALGAPDHDTVTAVRAETCVVRRRIKQPAAVWTGEARGGIRDRCRRGRRDVDRSLERLIGRLEAQKSPKERDLDHLGSVGHGAPSADGIQVPERAYTRIEAFRGRSGYSGSTLVWRDLLGP